MLFRHRVLLANCDSTKFTDSERAGPWFKRQFLTGLLCGNGVVINAASIADVPNILSTFEATAFIERCHELHEASAPKETPMVLVRGLESRTINLIDFFNSRPDDWKVSSYGGKLKGELTAEEIDETIARLSALSAKLTALGAVGENISPDAAKKGNQPGRLGRHIKLNIRTLRTQNQDRVSVPIDDRRGTLDVTFDELSQIAVSATSRSYAYAMIDDLVTEKRTDIATASNSDAALDLANQNLTDKLKSEFIDPAYHTIFLNQNEALINGSFDFADQFIMDALGRVRLLGATKEEFFKKIKSDNPDTYRLVEEIPRLIKRLRYIIMLFGPHSPAALFWDHVLRETIGTPAKLAATVAWSGFQYYFKYYSAFQPFNSEWDSAGIHESESKPIEPPSHKLDRVIKEIETAEDLKAVYDEFEIQFHH